MNLVAKTIVKNKFWIVEKDGQKVATIQTNPEGVTLVQNEKRENFVSIKLLTAKYSILFTKEPKKVKVPAVSFEVNGYPCNHKPLNALFNVTKKLPVFTKTAKSKSFFCAGHYLIKYNTGFLYAYCPKLITLNRYEFVGPFFTKNETKDYLKSSKGQS